MGVSIQVPREFQLYVGRTSIISKRRKVAGAPAPELTWEGVGGGISFGGKEKTSSSDCVAVGLERKACGLKAELLNWLS
jgi:hypothetical protein